MAALTVSFLVGGQEIPLPVTPSQFSWGAEKNLNAVDLNMAGTVYLPGNPSAHKDSLHCMFPARQYPFCAPGTLAEPQYYIDLFTRLAKQSQVVRYIVGDRINAQVLIEGFAYQEQDGTRDVYATIDLAEYISLDTVTTQTMAVNANTGNYPRTVEPEASMQYYTVVTGDCLSLICRRFYGNGTSTYYNALAKYNGIKNAHLIYPGQQLTIPTPEQLGVA